MQASRAEPPDALRDAQRLLQFTLGVLEQAAALAAAHEEPGAPAFDTLAGPHLRHVIEHYEALLLRGAADPVDYDGRARDRRVERSPALARERLAALGQRAAQLDAVALQAPVCVRALGGLQGEFAFQHASSVGRELLFLASHAVHHFALLNAYCEQHRIATPAGFGKAPATLAYERATPAAAASTAPGRRDGADQKDSPCPTPMTSA